MSAPLFFVSADQLAGSSPGSELILDGPEGHHGATVKRIGDGEQVLLTDGLGHRAEAVVDSALPEPLALPEVLPLLPELPVPPPELICTALEPWLDRVMRM